MHGQISAESAYNTFTQIGWIILKIDIAKKIRALQVVFQFITLPDKNTDEATIRLKDIAVDLMVEKLILIHLTYRVQSRTYRYCSP